MIYLVFIVWCSASRGFVRCSWANCCFDWQPE